MPRKKGPPTVSWSIRVFVADLKRWKLAAKRSRISPSEFVRRAVERAADRVLDTPEPPTE